MRIGKLTALAVQRAKRRGYYNDGGGLYLRVAESGSKSWVFRFRAAGKLREMGLGPVATLGLKEARERALACRRLRLDGIDPIEKRKAARSEAALKAANALTFRECAERYIAAHHDSWKNAKHAAQWPATLETYAYPVFGELPVDAVDVDLVIKAVEPIWKIKTETASRLRGRIEAVLDWATVRRLRHGENPARWRGHLNRLLPQRSKVQKVQHHAALPYSEIGGFMAELQKLEGAAAGALEFAILTATRTSEVLGAKWEEIDFAERVWTIPAERMKAGREHRVPLPAAGLAILVAMSAIRMNDYVFPGARAGRPLNSRALLDLLQHMGRKDITAHGFRSTFRDWCAERTYYPREICEQALAHTVGSSVERAYQRSDLIDRRRRLMDDWARFCAMRRGEVVPIRRPSD